MADWLAIKTEYVTGEASLQELAEKYGLSQSTIRKRSSSEKWVEQRDKYRNNVGTRIEQKTAEKISDTESEIAAIKSRTRLLIWAEIERRMGSPPEEMEGADFRRMVQNYCDMNNAEPDSAGPGSNDKEDDLSRSLRELGEELKNYG